MLLSLRKARRRFEMLAGGAADRGVPLGVSAATLIELMSSSKREAIGATGRPAWVAENISTIDLVLVVPQGRARLEALRCNCAIYQRGEFSWVFLSI